MLYCLVPLFCCVRYRHELSHHRGKGCGRNPYLARQYVRGYVIAQIDPLRAHTIKAGLKLLAVKLLDFCHSRVSGYLRVHLSGATGRVLPMTEASGTCH